VSVTHELDRFTADGLDHSRRYSEDYQSLWLSLGQAARSGKQLRSALLLATFHAYGGPDTASPAATRVAAAVELLHTAFVIHDDVIDKDLRRRGAPNVSGLFVERARARDVPADGRATLGLAAGVLAGDLALIGAVRAVALCGASPATTRRLLDLLSDAARISAAGELDDVALSVGAGGSGSLGDIITAEEHKTAVYSFQLPLQAGAVLAGAPDATTELLGTVGRLAGIGFQLVDDLRGVFADEAETGKDALGDLREGKATALISHARGTHAWPEIARHVGDPALDGERAEVARRLLEECGARAHVEELADGYLSAAVQAAEDGRLPASLVTELTDLCRRIRRSAA
jgi:geranylgeranyl diphosphate synthase, type II